MAITLYSTYIDYNGNRTFVQVANSQPVINCGDFQCGQNPYITDGGETINFVNEQYQYNCNCVCNCPMA